MSVTMRPVLLVFGMLIAGCGSSRSPDDAFVPAQTNVTSSGLDTCTPPPAEVVKQTSVAQQAQLTAAQTVRLCFVANTVRHEQWIGRHAKDGATRDRINSSIAREVDRAMPAVTTDRNAAPIVRAYLLGGGS